MRCCTGKCYTGAVDHHKEQRGGAFLPMQERADLGALGVFLTKERGRIREKKGHHLHPKEKDTKSNIDTKFTKQKFGEQELDRYGTWHAELGPS